MLGGYSSVPEGWVGRTTVWLVVTQGLFLTSAGLQRMLGEKDSFVSSRPVGREAECFQEFNHQCNFRVTQHTEEPIVLADRGHSLVELMTG